MPARWTSEVEQIKRKELEYLYWSKNLTLAQISNLLQLSPSTVYGRLIRLGIKTNPARKIGYLNKKRISLPQYSDDLAEFIGIMLGDGNISSTQVRVELGAKEKQYADYVIKLFCRLFGLPLKKSWASDGYLTLYLGSVNILNFLRQMGLVNNKVKKQIGIPAWVFKNNNFKKRFLRGLFDTDGSVYRLKFGWQISYCNRSLRLLKDTREILASLSFNPSRISGYNLYITRRKDLMNFAREIGSRNPSKERRLKIMGGWVSS